MKTIKREYLMIGLAWFSLWLGSAFIVKGLMRIDIFETMTNGNLLVKGYVNLIIDFFVMGIIVVLTRDEWKNRLKVTSKGFDTFCSWFIWSFCGVVVVLIGEFTVEWIILKFVVFDPMSQNTNLIMDMIQAVPLFIVATVLIGPIIEEVIFRKIMFGTLIQKFSFWFSSIISSLCFAIVHGELTYVPIYIIMGLVTSYLYYKTERIIVPIMTHVLVNYVTVMNLI
ncbi:lysostaphin resistance A-like protein [Bacillus thuringiensis]|uniref:CPBP family intramembrane glutamic endopeptidase n=1 Tax=Bacillus thuringiensis TaxID=1428 RepID=UPI00380CCC71